ncbi:MAG: hypothetical protein LBI42_01320 [Chitinispirillales bacterium]|nr:hypothetical protein [Chitinispirillales bacterium]
MCCNGIDTFEEEEEVHIKAVKREIVGIEREFVSVQGQMIKYLKELGI